MKRKPTRARPRPQLHASGLNLFGKCAKAFEYRYIEGRSYPPDAFKVVGTGVDRAVMADLANKITAHVLLEESAVADIAADTVRNGWTSDTIADEVPAGKSPQDAAIDKAVRLVRAHHNLVAPEIEPLADGLQKPFALSMDQVLAADNHNLRELDLVGTPDILEAARIRDLKTASKSKSQSDVDNSLQLTAYSLARTVETGSIPLVQLDVLVDLKAGVKPQILHSSRDEEDFAMLQRRVVAVGRGIKAGIFPPTDPNAWWCSSRWCGYHAICPYAVRPRSVAVAENLWEGK